VKIVVFGDSHIPSRASQLPTEFIDYVNTGDIDLVITTGDLTDYSILQELSVPKIISVRGNMDYGDIPLEETIEISNFKFYITHGHIVGRGKYKKLVSRSKNYNANVVVTGHTHEPTIIVISDVLVLNPGTITGAYGGTFPIHDSTFLELNVHNERINVLLFKIINGIHISLDKNFCLSDKIIRDC